MSSTVEERLRAAGLEAPALAAAAGNYAPFVRTGDLVFISGQISKSATETITGKLGAEIDVARGQDAARICALNLIGHLKVACDGDLERVRRVVKLTGFVNAAPAFDQHPAVINGASDLMVAAFGDAGRHARAAVGCGSLPFNVSVEVEGIFQIA